MEQNEKPTLFIPDDFDMKIKNLDTMLAIANACKTARDISIFAWMCKKMDKKQMINIDIAKMITQIGKDEKGKLVSKRTLYRALENMINADLIVRLSDGTRNGVREFMINPYLVLKHRSTDKEQYFHNRMMWDEYARQTKAEEKI